MNKVIIGLLVLSLLGNVIGLYFAYHFIKFRGKIESLQESLDDSAKIVSDLTDKLEAGISKRIIFLHHSVGKNILQQGGLRDSLLEMGIFVKGATYGDEIGQFTDVCHWTPKFSADFDQILKFKNHPNVYYTDDRRNDIIMFKSCFPNSDISGEGSGSGDPTSRERTIANYRAAFEEIGKQFAKHPDRLIIYWTTPPLTPASTTPEAAKRAREFNNWVTGEYLSSYRQKTGLNNFYVFDLYSILSDDSNVLRQEFRPEDATNSHPNEVANTTVARHFMEFFKPILSEWESRTQTPGTQAALRP